MVCITIENPEWQLQSGVWETTLLPPKCTCARIDVGDTDILHVVTSRVWVTVLACIRVWTPSRKHNKTWTTLSDSNQ